MKEPTELLNELIAYAQARHGVDLSGYVRGFIVERLRPAPPAQPPVDVVEERDISRGARRRPQQSEPSDG